MRRGASVVVAAVVATAAAPGATDAQSTRQPHSPADVRFMQGMLHHHAQAVVMAALVPTRTERADLRALAQRIDVSQVDEMELMRLWLRDRGEPVPDVTPRGARDTAGAHAAHEAPGAAGLMPGMLSAAELERLANAHGPTFDRLFLEAMIKHHEGALVMVRELFAKPGAGQETAIFSFASDVDADQRAEIARMRKLLAALPR